MSKTHLEERKDGLDPTCIDPQSIIDDPRFQQDYAIMREMLCRIYEYSGHQKLILNFPVGQIVFGHSVGSHPTSSNTPSPEVIDALVEATTELLSVEIKVPTHSGGWISFNLSNRDELNDTVIILVSKIKSALALIDREKK